MKTAGWIVLAALGGWLVRSITLRAVEPTAAPVHVIQQTIAKTEAITSPPNVVVRTADRVSSLGQRNLFAYRANEQPAIATRIVHTPPPPIRAAVQPAIVEEPSALQPVAFPYRYIGTFGPPHHRVVAFKSDGDIHTLFVGDRIGAFTVRAIGIESVEVEGPDGVRRIPLTDSL